MLRGEILSGINPESTIVNSNGSIETPKRTLQDLRTDAIGHRSAEYITQANLSGVEIAPRLRSVVENGGKLTIDIGGNLIVDRPSTTVPAEKR